MRKINLTKLFPMAVYPFTLERKENEKVNAEFR